MLFDDPNKLSNEEIHEDLVKQGYSSELIDSIIEQFWFHDWGNSFIAPKENFAILQKFLTKAKPKTFSRFDFYSFFFSTTVTNYQKISKSLQKIGVAFELIHTDRVTPVELEKILKELKVTEEISLKFLVEAKLVEIIEEEKKQVAKWMHHTLTEYLSTIYILEQKDIFKTIDKFICNSESGAITFIPSWAGTLRFLVEKEPKRLIDWLETNLNINPDFLNDQLAEVIVFDTFSNIPEEYKTKLFHIIYDAYQEKKWWIPVWAYHNLYKFINAQIYQSLKENADNENFEYKGNTAAVIDGMLKNHHPLITPPEEQKFWRDKLIKYANDENTNGVLQRHSLAALENFVGDSSIIEAVAGNDKSKATLVKEAFMNLCKTVDPNSPKSIEFFIKAISDDTAHIYARNALYSIDSKAGIIAFLKEIAENQQFIHEFLDKESIFNKKEKQADKAIIENIENNLDLEISDLIKKLIITAFTGERNYRAGDSYFLQQLALLVKSQEPKYLQEIVTVIRNLPQEEKNHLFINDIEGMISVLLDVDQLAELKKVFNDTLHHHAGYAFAEAIRLAPKNDNPNGQAVLKKGIELGITIDPNAQGQQRNYQEEQNEKIYNQFQKFLNPGENKYFPQVFRYFIENKKFLQTKATTSEKERLLDLAVESNLEKIEPSKIEMHYNNPEIKSGEYTISSVASYFPAVLEVIHELKPEILQKPENRKKLIDFIPFSYLSDFKSFREILGEITDAELEPLNKTMLDKTKDVRYLIPQTYIYLAEVLPNLKSPKVVLLSFIKDSLIADHDREYALETLRKYLTSSDTDVEALLKELWEPTSRSRTSDLANALLISVFHNKEAINWRFNILKTSAKPFHRQEGAHSVGELELELDYTAFAKPLIELNNEAYLDHFIDLLNFSLSLIDQVDYWDYVNYLWRIVIASVVRENFLLSESAYSNLKNWAEGHKDTTNVNWFYKRLESAFEQFINSNKKGTSLKEALTLIK